MIDGGPQQRDRHGGGGRAGLHPRAQRSGAGADRPARGFPVRHRARRHGARRRRGDRRRRARLLARRRDGRRLHDRARPGAGASRQARAGGDRRRRAADECRRARHDRGDEPAQPRRSCASTTATTARPAGRRAIPASGVDLEKIAVGAGIKRTRTVATEADIADGARLLREGNGTAFVVLRVQADRAAAFKRNFDASLCRDRFRAALQARARRR